MLQVTSGVIRKLTSVEKTTYKGYKYVTLSEFEYSKGDRKIVVPKGFLTDGSSGGPNYGCSWLFHDYLYASHRFTSGQKCTREQADMVMEEVLANERLSIYCWIFVRLSKMNPFWLFSRAWKNSGSRGPQMIDYELKKDM